MKGSGMTETVNKRVALHLFIFKLEQSNGPRARI
jgi:hypothetical protein